MDLYNIQKSKFSSFHSNYQKLLNKINKTTLHNDTIKQIIVINNLLEILESKILDFNENNYSFISDNELDNINKNNKVIEDLKPLFLYYRMLLN